MAIRASLGIADLPGATGAYTRMTSPNLPMVAAQPYAANRYGDGGIVKYPSVMQQGCGTANNPCVAMPNYGGMNFTDCGSSPAGTAGCETYTSASQIASDPNSDPCARISALTQIGARLSPETAKALTDACAQSRGIAPGQPARYDTETGEVTNAAGEAIDPTTGLPVTPWYKNPTYWMIGGAALLGVWLISK